MPQGPVLPTATQSRAAQGTPAARLLFWNGTLLVALGASACPTPRSQLLRCKPSSSGALHHGHRARAGALVFAFPHAVEAVHPHRKGEADIQESIKICATVLMGVGALYSYVGGQNLQACACLSATAKPAHLRRCRSVPHHPNAAHGALHAQEYMFGLLMHRLVAVPLLGFCVHFGKISAMELAVLLSLDTAGAVAALALHRRDLRRARVGKNL